MKVCIPIAFQPHGGGFHFLKLFEAHLTGAGWEICRSASDPHDVLFTNHWMVSRSDILKAVRHNPRVRIVQRIDGAAEDYGRRDDADPRQRAVNRLADLTIFQSRYCRYSTREKFRVILRDGPVIHNPVDVDLFSPDGPRETFPQTTLVVCVTWSLNPLKGAAQVFETAGRNPDVGFVLCGNFPDAPDLPNLYSRGVLGRQDLAVVLRSCDVLLTYSRNEACPNHVLEALASGLPVLYGDSGAMSEVIGECGQPVDVDDFAAGLRTVMERRDELSVRARRRAVEHFHPDQVLERYRTAMQDALAAPTAVPIGRRLMTAWYDGMRTSGHRLKKRLCHTFPRRRQGSP